MNTFRPISPPRGRKPRALWLGLLIATWLLALFTLAVPSAVAQDGNCTATVLNRTAQLGPGGTIAIPNVPYQLGYFRVRVTCISGGVTTVGQSDYFQLNPNGPSNIGPIKYGQLSPLPISIAVSAPVTTLNSKGQTVQLTATVSFANGTSTNAPGPNEGTLWISSNPNIATVTPNGLVTAVARGNVIIQAINEGVQTAIQLTMLIPNDADNDGITDEYETANNLNPNDASDAGQDTDGDGLTNLQEFLAGANPRAADTDGDGLLDGQEISGGTNALLADSDADGLTDGQEVLRGSNPMAGDTDSDGIADGLEVQLGLSLTNANPTTTVEGRVLDTTSAPVSGAAVTLFDRITVNTDASGFFTIANVPTEFGPLTVAAQIVRTGQILDGASNPINPVAGGLTSVGNIQIGLNAGTVAGVVTDPFGMPVAGALVTVTAGTDVRTATANGVGQYRVNNMTAGNLIVTARDFRTGLRGRSLGTLPLNSSSVINVQLGPFGTVRGTVFGRDNTTPVGAGATVAYSGNGSQQVATDPLGRYNFEFVGIGGYNVDASDAAGNRGRSGGDISATAQVNVNDIGYLGAGQVVGVVRDGSLNPVANAFLSLSSGSVFGGHGTTTSDGAGRFAFSNVLIGTYFITAQAPGSGLAGHTNGTILSNNQRNTNNIVVASSGSITGLVFRADGVTPLSGVSVRVSPSGLQTNSGSNGEFRFDLLPLGGYTVSATDNSTGDRGSSTATISSQNELREANITMNGLGTVVVTVRDGASNLVQNAQVHWSGTGPFGGSRSGVTDANGVVTLTNVLAGGFNVSSTDPGTGFGGSVSGNVGVGATVLVTVRLQSFGSVAGTVFQPDGTTPAGGITVRISGQVGRTSTTAPDGTFRFDTLPTSTYSLDASDSGGVRAYSSGVVLSSQGQLATRNLTLIGLGTVEGIVSRPDSSPAANVGVSVSGQASGYGRSFFTLTDINGRYSVTGVPVGPFAASSSGQSGNATFYGATSGSIASHEQTVTANIQLSESLIPVTTTLYDANNFGYQLRESGAIQDGSPGGMWGGDFSGNRGAFILDIVGSGGPERFTGQAFGSAEDGGREVVIQQNGLGGLNVARKIFVPREGYFVRYLEVLSNPSNAPVTVDVRLTSHFRFIQKVQNGFNFQREPQLVATSSGDALLDIADPGTRDRWLLIDDDEDLDPFLVGSSLPVVGDVFDGPGAPVQLGTTAYDIDFNARFGKLVQNFTNLTIPAGGTVVLMHFGFEQITRTAGLASAQRLAQLPPEALAGMTLTEMAQVANFAVPTNGSALAALPPLNGSINGRTLSGDGSNIVAGAGVRFQSSHPIFGRTWNFAANGQGQFSFTGFVNGFGSSFVVPIADFTLVGTHPLSGVATAPVLGSFPNGLLTATRDVIFSDTGVLTGTVRRHNNVVVSSGTVRISGGGILNTIFLSIAANGTFGMSGLPAGLYTVTATAPIGQGSDLTATTTASVSGGQTVNVNLVMPETGTISGLISRQDSSPGVNAGVQLHGTNGLSRTTTADTGGRYTFTDVPSGPVTLNAFDPLSNTAAQAQTNAVPDQNVVVNMTLIPGGTVAGLVTLSGQAVTNAQVTITANNGTFNTTTGLDGTYSFFPVEPGPVSVQAMDPQTSFRGSASGNLNNSGGTLTLNLALFASGSITGVVYHTDGVTPIPSATVTISGPVFRSATADALGQFSFDVVPLGSYSVRGVRPGIGEEETVNVSLGSNLQVATANIVVKPNVTIANASLTEGNVGTTNLPFMVTLSSPSLQQVQVSYSTANGSASAADFFAASGTLTFAPGTTSQPVNVTIRGDVLIEVNETFSVILLAAVNATISDGSAAGTIVNNDGFAGQVDHFVWSAIPAVQFVNESFPVAVTAMDAFDNIVTDFSGPVALSGVIASEDVTVGTGNVLWNFPLASFYHDARLQSIYLAGELGQSRNITGLALDVAAAPGQMLGNFTIRMKHTASTGYGLNPVWESSGWTVVVQTNLTVTGTGWLVLPFSAPFAYNGVDNLIIDFSFNNSFYTADGSTRSTDTALNRSLFHRTDSGAGDPLGWAGAMPSPSVIARVPNLRLLGSEAGVTMTPLISGSFTNGIWGGNLTVQQLATNLVLRADDGDGHLGDSAPLDVLIHNDLALAVTDSPDPVQVGAPLTYTLTVTNSGPQSATAVVLTNQLPANATFVSATTSQGTFTQNAGVVRVDLGAIAGASSATVTIIATPTAVGSLTNRANVVRGEVDPFPGNDFAAVVTTVLVPSIVIEDVNGPEGNSAASAGLFSFNVRLSYPNSQNVTVAYTTTNGTALATADYAATNGLVTFLPGQTNRTVEVRIIGDTIIEPNETFFVNLVNPTNATLADNQALATITNDDGLPGQISHFEWAGIPSPQFANEPFAVSVIAKDSAGNTVSNYSGPALLSAFSGSAISNRILGDIPAVNSANSGPYTFGYSFTPNTNITVTHVRHYFGNKVSIWAETGVLLASQSVVSSPGAWVETPLNAPIALTAGVRYRVTVYTESTYYYRFDVGSTFSNGVINLSYQRQGDGFPTLSDSVRWWFVDLRYNVGTQVPVAVTPDITTTFTNGVWSGPVTLAAFSITNLFLSASDGDGHRGDSAPFTMLYRDDLLLTVSDSPDPVGAGANLAYTVTVSNTGPSAAMAVVVTNRLASSVTYGSSSVSQGTVTTSLPTLNWNVGTLAAGATATMTVQGTPTAPGSITNIAGVTRAEVDAFAGNNLARETTTVLQPTLTVSATNIVEGNFGLRSVGFQVQLSYPSPQTVQVGYYTTNGTALFGSDYFTATGTLVFAPGQTTTNVIVSVVGDTAIEVNESFSLVLRNPVNATIATAEAATLILNDDGIPGQIDHFDWAMVPSPQYVNEPFPVMLTAKDSFGDTVTDFAGPVTLSAAIGGTAVTNRIIGDDVPTSSSSGNFTLGYSFTPNTNITVTHVRHYFGTKVSIWSDNGTLIVSQAVSSTGNSWSETQLPSPVALLAGNRYRLAAYSGPGTYRWNNSSVFNFPNGTIDQNNEGFGDVFPSGNSGSSRWLVDVRYTVGTSANVPVSPMLSGSFTNGVWAGPMVIQGAGENVILRADDGNGHAGEANGISVQRQNDLSVFVTATPAPADVRSNLTYTINLTNTGPNSATAVMLTNILPLEVNFISANASVGTPVRSGRIVTAALGTLAGGGTAQVVIQVKPVLDSITLTNVSTVSRGEADSDLANNLAVTETRVRTLGGGTGRVALLAADDTQYYSDVRAKLLATGLFEGVDAFDMRSGNPVPTLAQLDGYGAVLVWDNYSFSNPTAIGNLLADYVDAGGGVVAAVFAFESGDLGGRFSSGGYLPVASSGSSSGFSLSLVKDDPAHPILEEVNSFSGGSSSYHSVLSVRQGSTLVAHWNNNRPLVVTRETSSGRVVALNMFPPSSTVSSGFWDASTDGARLMANSLLWAAPSEGNVPDDLSLLVTESFDPVAFSNTLTLTIMATNSGPSDATGVMLTNIFPSTAGLVSFNTSQGTAVQNSGALEANFGVIPGGSNATLTVVLQTMSVGTLTNLATVARAEPDGYLRNNQIRTLTSVVVPQIRLFDGSITEGDLGVTNLQFPVQLSVPAPYPVGFSFVTFDSSAIAGVDYTQTSGVLVFAPGETNKVISVPVINDLLNEFDEEFSVNITDATNALIADGFAEGLIIENDPEPDVAISDVQLVERNVGSTNALFNVTLSAPSGRAITVSFATSPNTAVAGVDYIHTNSSIFFPIGQTSAVIPVRVISDITIEPDESFFVNLTGADYANIADGQGLGMVVNDDGLAGELYQFQWALVPSPQYVNEPFQVTLTAQDSSGNTLSGFNGTAMLSATAGGNQPTDSILGEVTHNNSFGGTYTVGYAFTPNTNIVVTHVRHYSGTKVSLWTETGTLLFSHPVTSVAGTWTETPLPEPVQLLANVRYRIGVLNTQNYYRFDLPLSFAHGAIHSSYYLNGDGFPGNSDSPRWYFVDLRYAPGEGALAPVMPSVTGSFTNGVWSGNIAVQLPGEDVVLRASDGDGHSGRAERISVGLRNDLAVYLSASPDRGDVRSNLVYSIMVSNSGPATISGIMLTNVLPSELNFVSTVPSQGTASTVNHVVVCNLGSLTGSAVATITITTKPNTDGAITNRVTVASTSGTELFLANNSASVVTRVTPPPGGGFRIVSLTTNNAVAVEHTSITGDDRGGVALSDTHFYVTGDSLTARFLASDLSNGLSIGNRWDSLITDLATRRVYVLANGTVPLTSSGGTLTALLALDSETGQLTGDSVPVSIPIIVNENSGEVGFFSGYGHFVIHVNGQVYDIDFTTGAVTSVGAMPMLAHQGSESWAYWGVAEKFGGELNLVYVFDFETIVRTRVPDQATSTVAAFSNLSDMASFVVSIPDGRWYFHHEGTSQFRSGNETAGFADATFEIESASSVPDDLVLTQEAPPNVVSLGSQQTYSLRVTNTGPAVANGVILTNLLPAGATFISATPSQGSVSATAGRVVVQFGTLAGGASAEVSILVQISSSGVLTNVANVVRSEPDGYLPNNRVQAVSTAVASLATVADVEVFEGDAGSTVAQFDVQLFPPPGVPVSIEYVTLDSSAASGEDFDFASGTVVFNPGETNKAILITIHGDTDPEAAESFMVSFSNLTNVTMTNVSANAVILNDDVLGVVYVRSSDGLPWGSFEDNLALDMAFGSGNWTDERYETVAPETLFSPQTQLIILEGGNQSTAAFTNFMMLNAAAIQSWVADGGRMFISIAPSEDEDFLFDLGFGVILNYSFYSSDGLAVDPGHAIFSGPFVPSGTVWSGGWLSTAILNGTMVPVISGYNGETLLAESIGTGGLVLFGTLTPADYHSNMEEALNLRANMFAYAATGPLNGSGAPAFVGQPNQLKLVRGSDSVQLEISGQNGDMCLVQCSTDLVNWTTISTNCVSGSNLCIQLPIRKDQPQLFYRTIRLP